MAGAIWVSVTQPIRLGLDLRGGSHLLLEIDAAAVIGERMYVMATVRLSDLGGALSMAVRTQSMENAPLLVFAAVGAVLGSACCD